MRGGSSGPLQRASVPRGPVPASRRMRARLRTLSPLRAVLLVAVVAALPAEAGSSASVSGVVRDAAGPLAGATVRVQANVHGVGNQAVGKRAVVVGRGLGDRGDRGQTDDSKSNDESHDTGLLNWDFCVWMRESLATAEVAGK